MTVSGKTFLRLLVAGGVIASVCPTHSVAQQPSVAPQPPTGTTKAGEEVAEDIPPPLTHYRGREIAQTMHYLGADWLTRESRQREEDCTQLLEALHLKKGQVVCDLGCGNGFYTLSMAAAVGGEGQVYAVDIQPEMLRLLGDRVRQAGLTNIKPVLGTVVDPKLPPNALDLVLLVDVYHELSHPEQVLGAISKALKPDGVMVLVEFRLEDPRVPIKLLHKMSKQQILKEIPPNGFQLVEQYDRLPWQHVMFFRRGEPEGDAPGDARLPAAGAE